MTDVLFEPIEIGAVTLRNRIVCLPHSTGLGVEGRPTAGHVHYYARRARGGVALIIQESTPVHRSAVGRSTTVRGYDPAIVPALADIAQAVHAEGARILAQLSHRGLAASSTFSEMPVWAPSPIVSPFTGEVAHGMTRAEIGELLDGFRTAARNFVSAGYDGVEIHAAHGHLLPSFVSAKTNLRDDDYGGPLRNRLRLIVEALAAVRETIGAGILGIRVSVSGWPGAADIEETRAVMEAVEPFVDYVSATGGDQFQDPADFYVDPATLIDLAAAVKGLTRRPVLGLGHAYDPARMRAAIAAGQLDLVGTARAVVADPDWSLKVASGRAAEIRRCIRCNVCYDRLESGTRIGCIYNPEAGREDRLPVPGSGPGGGAAPRVAVVGGGPAGMQAALTLAGLGLRVALIEARDRLGGQLLAAAALPGRATLGELTTYYEAALARAGVEVRLGAPADADRIAAEGFAGAVVATGAHFRRWPLAAAIGVPEVTFEAVLARAELPGRNALVIVQEGGPIGIGVAELLADGRCDHVRVVCDRLALGWQLPRSQRAGVMARLARRPNIDFSLGATLESVDPSGVVTLNLPGGRLHPLPERADFAVLAQPGAGGDGLAEVLRAAGLAVRSAGDCLAPRNIQQVVSEADEVARSFAAALFVGRLAKTTT